MNPVLLEMTQTQHLLVLFYFCEGHGVAPRRPARARELPGPPLATAARLARAYSRGLRRIRTNFWSILCRTGLASLEERKNCWATQLCFQSGCHEH